MVLLLVLSLLSPIVVPAQGSDLQVAASVDKTELSQSEPLLYSITIAGELKETPQVELKNFPGFQVVATGQSQQIHIGAGQMKQALTLTYTLAPTQMGTHTLGPVRIQYQGKTYETQPIEVKVIEGQVPRKKEQVAPKSKPKLRRTPPQLDGGVVI